MIEQMSSHTMDLAVYAESSYLLVMPYFKMPLSNVSKAGTNLPGNLWVKTNRLKETDEITLIVSGT